MQVGNIRRRKERPLGAFHHALHEEVGDPVRCVHVVRAAAIITGVLAQLEELLDIEVPRLEIAADRALALAAVVRERRRRHVRLVAFDLEVVDERLGRDRRDLFDAAIELAADFKPIRLERVLESQQPPDFGDGGNAELLRVAGRRNPQP